MTARIVDFRTVRRAAAIAIATAAVVAAASAPASASVTKLQVTTPYAGVAAPGTQVTAHWAGILSPSGTDWVGLYRYGAGDTSYLAWRYTNGAANGSGTLTVPRSVTPGLYELRLYARNGYTRLASVQLVVKEPSFGVSVGISHTTVRSGQQVTISWNRPLAPSSTDWIGLYRSGASDSYPVFWFYTGSTSSWGSAAFTLPSMPRGYYELRLFSNNTNLRLSTASLYSTG